MKFTFFLGQLRPPSFHLSSTLLQATPLGAVPGKNGVVTGAVSGGNTASLPVTPSQPLPPPGSSSADVSHIHPGLGTVPGRRFSEQVLHSSTSSFGGGEMEREPSDFDETEPLGRMTSTQVS